MCIRDRSPSVSALASAPSVGSILLSISTKSLNPSLSLSASFGFVPAAASSLLLIPSPSVSAVASLASFGSNPTDVSYSSLNPSESASLNVSLESVASVPAAFS